MTKLFFDIETLPAPEEKKQILKEFHTIRVNDGKGKNVAKAFEDGRIKEICEYCKKDVDLTRKIYKKMIFEE